MDWANERYVRLYTRDTVTWKMWPWEARAIFPLLMRKVDRAGVLVSFNGKSFDLPALESRAILARRRPNWRQLPHLDLLHGLQRLRGRR